MQRINFKPAQQKRFAIRRRWTAALAFCLALRAGGGGIHAPAYLPTVGPAPLRFMAAMVVPTNIFKLPEPPPPAPDLESSRIQIPPPPAGKPASIVTRVSSAPPVLTNEFNPRPDVTTPDGVISPQMLLRFFNKTTNGPSTSVTAPMDFRPPNPAPAPASKATYSTGP